VDGLVSGFGEILGGMREITAALPRAERLRIFHGTAAETYRLA
jgi:predicted TIM-barrel fold metal-dependent hydrolase